MKYLKGLGHAILGNFSIDKIVIELKQNTGKLKRDKDGQNWGGLKWIEFGKI